MRKSNILRKFRFYLLLGLCLSTALPLSAQDRDRRRGDRDGSSDRGGFRREGDRGEGGFGGRESRGPSGDFGGREFRGPPGGFGGGFGGPPGGFGGGGFGGGEFQGGESFRRDRGNFDPSFGGESPSSSGPTPPRKVTITAKERVTIDLPSTYSVADLDHDGQIAFYEWRQWKRGDLVGFQAIDADSDGFLTPRELTKGPVSAGTTPTMSVAVASAVPTTDAAPPAAMEPASTSTDPAAVRYFGLIDQNRDGMITSDEWTRAARTKTMFTEAGIDLTVPMPKDQFVAQYTRLSPAAK